VRETLLLATRSADKTREIRVILGAAGIEIRTLDDLGVKEAPAEDEIEAFDTFRENARAKALHFQRLTGLPTLADDSGIQVRALGNEPGVRSKRFSGRDELHGTDLDRLNNRLLLERLAGVPDVERAARYVCAAVLLRPDGRWMACLGSVTGRIAHEPSGAGGFGYDPLFFVPAIGLTFAEIDLVTKNGWSHRGRAFRALAAALH
jgi:XTP/dITP diphosphohydrolase